jgi:hypothetical protein
MYTCLLTYIHVYVYIHTCIHVYIHTYTYLYILILGGRIADMSKGPRGSGLKKNKKNPSIILIIIHIYIY